MKSIKIPQWSKDIAVITSSDVAIILTTIFTTSLLAQYLSIDNFGYFSTYKRIGNLVTFFILGGIMISIRRYVSQCLGDDRVNQTKKFSYIFLSYLKIAVSFPLFAILFFLFVVLYGNLILPQTAETYFAYFSIILFIFSLTMQNILYVLYQGQNKILKGIVIYCISVAIIPFIIALLAQYINEPIYITYYTGLLRFLFLVVPFCFILYISFKTVWKDSMKTVKSVAKEFITYSEARTFGGFGLMAISCLGPVIATVIGFPKYAGYLEVTQIILTLVNSVSAGLNFVLLSSVAKLATGDKKNDDRIRLIAIKSLNTALMIGIFITFQVVMAMDFIIPIWLGVAYKSAIPIINITLIGMIPYFVYVFMRGIIDAHDKVAINTRHTLMALCVMVLITGILLATGYGIQAVIVSIVCGYTILGFTTLLYCIKKYHITFERLNFLSILLPNLIAIVILTFIKSNYPLLSYLIVDGTLIVSFILLLIKTLRKKL